MSPAEAAAFYAPMHTQGTTPMAAFPRSHGNEPRFIEQDICSSAVEANSAEVEAAVEAAYGSFHNLADYMEKADNFLGKHAQYADWREARSDAAADVQAVHVLMVQAEMAMAAVVQAMSGRGA